MSDFLGRLAQRVVAPESLLQPRAPSLFEAVPSEPTPIETAAIDAVVPSREIAATSATVPASTARTIESPPRPAGKAPEAREAEAAEERMPVERLVAETPVENAAPVPSVITRDVVERIPIEAAAVEALATPAPAATRPPTPPPVPRVVTRRAVEARPAHRAAPVEAKELASAPAAERDVHITIGRIDVRAVTPPPRERPATKTPRTLTLDEYLAQRSRR